MHCTIAAPLPYGHHCPDKFAPTDSEVMMKLKFNIWLSAAGISLLLGCSSSDGAVTPPSQTQIDNAMKADTVLTNAKIYTVNDAMPWASNIAIKDGEIIYVGDKDGADFIGTETEVKDLQGKLVLPGFHDVHMHPLESGSDATQFLFPENVDDAEQLAQYVEQAAQDNPRASWLIGFGHSVYSLFDAKRSPREILDDVVPNRPVIIMEHTSHSMWVNSEALYLAGIDANSPDPQGGLIGRDVNGEPDGVLYDNAGDLVMEMAIIAQNTADNDYYGFTEFTQPELSKHGITSISDARVYWKRGQLETWKRLRDNNELNVRVALGLWAYPTESDEFQINELISMYENSVNSLLKVNQIKFYMDGILINTTAALHQPYETQLLPIEGNKGLNYFTPERLQGYLKALEPVGFDFNIHAIGDRGVSEALDAIEKASDGKARHRLTHVEMVRQQDLSRFKSLNVIADAQVAGDFAMPGHWHENIPLLGEARSDNLVPIRSLSEAGATLTLSSDWNVSTMNPFVGIHHAVTRAPQAITP